MSDHDDGLDTSFISIRRNLNLVTILMIVLAFTDAEIKKLAFLGIHIELNQSKFYLILWVAVFYFLWRYFHFLDKKKLNQELITWNWSYFNRLARQRGKEDRMLKYYVEKRIGFRKVKPEPIITAIDPAHSKTKRSVRVTIGSKIHELKVSLHLYCRWYELIYQQFKFALRTHWFFTLYLPILLSSLLLISILRIKVGPDIHF